MSDRDMIQYQIFKRVDPFVARAMERVRMWTYSIEHVSFGLKYEPFSRLAKKRRVASNLGPALPRGSADNTHSAQE